MFDKILELVKEHFENNPEIKSKLTDEQKDAVATEVATHLTTGLTNHEALPGGTGGILSMLENAGSILLQTQWKVASSTALPVSLDYRML